MKRRKTTKPPKPGTTVSFDQSKEVRAIARERVGAVKPSHPILPKTVRKKPKHKKPLGDEGNGS
jgi:hypothetical protein